MNSSSRQGRRGAALVFALVMLALFAALGTGYVRSMNLEVDRVNIALRETRARLAAEGGLRAALAELARSGNAAAAPAGGQVFRFELPVYDGRAPEGALEPPRNAERRASVEVRVTDESGKADPNHLPAAALETLLGIDAASAQRIVESRPRADQPGGRWLDAPADLVGRGFLGRDRFEAVRGLLTTDTVLDPARPQDSLNINAAPAEVIAAIAGVPVEQARGALAQRPFASMLALSTAVGKPLAGFAVRPALDNLFGMPAPLALRSRCFRLESRAAYASAAGGIEWNRATAAADALVRIDDAGNIEIVRWTTRAGGV